MEDGGINKSGSHQLGNDIPIFSPVQWDSTDSLHLPIGTGIIPWAPVTLLHNCSPEIYIYVHIYTYIKCYSNNGTAKCLRASSSQHSFCQTFYVTVTPQSLSTNMALSDTTASKLLNTNQDLVWMGLDQPKTLIKIIITKQKKITLEWYKFWLISEGSSSVSVNYYFFFFFFNQALMDTLPELL